MEVGSLLGARYSSNLRPSGLGSTGFWTRLLLTYLHDTRSPLDMCRPVYICMILRLEDFVDMDLRLNSYALNLRQLRPFIARKLERAEEGGHLSAEGRVRALQSWGCNHMFEWPAEAGEITATAKSVESGDRWFETRYYWYSLHVIRRLKFFLPTPVEGGPDLNCLMDRRFTLMTFPEGNEELLQDPRRTEHHDLVERQL